MIHYVVKILAPKGTTVKVEEKNGSGESKKSDTRPKMHGMFSTKEKAQAKADKVGGSVKEYTTKTGKKRFYVHS